MIHFDLPKDKSSIIKVIGVGGGGSNAVNHMNALGIDGVNFIICNTDAQALAQSKVANKIQLGPHLTQGLGAGANPSVGKQATEESLEEIKKILEVNTKMVFVTAGMGGGTGTGGAPIVSKICKEMGILTVGIVTTPFAYEGPRRMKQAEDGINQLKEHVDTLLVINNNKLRHQFGNLKMSELFAKADNILSTAAKCITDVIGSTGQINVDFADVCTVMRDGGVAILGNAEVAGENRAQLAIEEALNSPLLNDNDIKGARWILVNINSGGGEHEHTMDEIETIQTYIMNNAGEKSDVILGLGFDAALGEKISVTLIATGFESKNPFEKPATTVAEVAPEKIVMTLGIQGEETKMEQTNTLMHTTQVPPTPVDPMAPQLVQYNEVAPTIALESEPNVAMPAQQEPTVQLTLLPQELATEPIVINQLTTATTQEQPSTATTVPMPISECSTTTVNTFPSKPANIYNAQPTPVANIIQVHNTEQDAEQPTVMEMYIKDEAADTTPQETPQPVAVNDDAIEQTMVSNDVPHIPSTDLADDSLTKAAERSKKLRNLSYNFNDMENDEFENQPAYLRRKTEIHNTLANVEKFYSNYTVNVDDNNDTVINTNSKNSFLEGNKPD